MLCGDSGGKNSIGEPCRRAVQVGFTRCNMHGGAAPASKMKAEQALSLARMPAIEALNLIIERFLSKTCGACGLPSGDSDESRVIVRTATAVLDRTGMGAKSMIELTSQTDGAINLELLTDEERGRLLVLLAEVKDIKRTLRERAMGALAGNVPTPDGSGLPPADRVM